MYRNFPFSASKSKNSNEISLKESIARHVQFLVFTKKGEHKFDPDLGCDIWHDQYSSLKEEELVKVILDAVSKEKRLKSISFQKNKIDYNTQKQELSFSLEGVLESGDILQIPLIIPIIITIEYE